MKKEARIIIVVVVVIVVSTVSFLRKFSLGGKEENRSIAFFANIVVLEIFVKNLIIVFLSLSVVPVRFVDIPCTVSPAGSKIFSRGSRSLSLD